MEINLLQSVVATMLYNANITYSTIDADGSTVTCDAVIPFTAGEVLTETKKLEATLAVATAERIAAEEALKNLSLQQLKDKIASATTVDEILTLTANQ